MNADCGYDSSSSSMDSSDCLSLCSSFGCSEVLLNNDSCDPECDLPECGFDKGQCGYCWSGCFESDLLDSIQNSNCNNIYCYYDASLFKECSPGCTNQMLLNSDCDSECNTSLCNFDFGKCQGISSECSESCLSSYLGNGICNEECNNQECSFDDYDCLCAPECTEDLLTNGICDEVCSKGTCEDDCACDSKCENSYGDGICDEDCWNEMCEWIDKDCGCSPDCKLEEIASCKKECLVKDCNFGDMGENAKCEDSLKLELARSYQIINADFDLTTSIEDCQSVSLSLFGEACSEDMLANDPCHTLESGEQPCNIIECGFALGWCSTGCDCGDGSRCFVDNSSKCLSCSDKKQFFYKCVEECPLGFEADSSNLCMHLEDTSSKDSPKEYYVKNGLTDYGDGSEESPFSSVSIALARIYTKFSVIRLEENEHYTLSSIPDDLVFIGLDQKRPLSRPYFKPENLTLQGSNSFLEIQSQDFLTFDAFSGILEIRSIIFSAPNLSDKCEEDCDFCDEDCTEDCVPDCSLFEDSNLISIHSGSLLILSDVEFQNMRNNFNSLIYIYDGNLELTNVDFNRVKAKSSISSAIITSEKSEYINYTNGKVTLLNDGYKMYINRSDGFSFSGFLLVLNIDVLTMKKIEMTYNIVYKHRMISIIAINKLLFSECHIEKNIMLNGFLHIDDAITPTYSLLRDSNNTVAELSDFHLQFLDSVFVKNYLQRRGIIEVHYPNFPTNLKFENLTFDDNVMKLWSYFIEINNESIINKYEHYAKIYVNSKRVLAHFPSRKVEILSSYITNNILWTRGAIEIIDHGNILIDSLHADNLNSEYIDLYDWLYTDFIENTLSTAPDTASPRYYTIDYMFNLLGNSILTMKNFSFSRTNIYDGKGIYIEDTTEFIMESSAISQVENESRTGIVIVSNVPFSEIRDSEFFGNSNADILGIGVFIFNSAGEETVHYYNCTCRDNQAALGACFLTEVSIVHIANSTFESNTGLSNSFGALVHHVTGNDEEYTIENSTFSGNRSPSGYGAGLYMYGDGQIFLGIADCTFKENEVLFGGSAVKIETGVFTKEGSSITDCSFERNDAGKGTLAFYGDGALLIESCSFLSNTGAECAALYHSGSSTFDLIVQNSNFTKNSAASILYIDNFSIFNKVATVSCLFEENEGKPAVINYAFWHDRNSVFSYNYDRGTIGTGSKFTYFSQGIFENTSFLNNESITGSALFIETSSSLDCSGCNFSFNYAYEGGGAIFVDNGSINIKSSKIYKNSCTESYGGALVINNTGYNKNNITDTEISYNQSGLGFVAVVVMGDLYLDNVSFFNNTSEQDYPGIFVNLGKVFVQNSQFYNLEGIRGPSIIAVLSETYITRSQFFNTKGHSVGGALYLKNVNGEISDCSFKDIESEDGGAIYITAETNLIISKSKFESIQSTIHGVITGQESVLNLTESEFKNYLGNAVACMSCKSFTVDRSSFVNGTADDGGGIHALDADLEIKNSYFSNLHANNQGGAVFASGSTERILRVVSSAFENNTSTDGGGIYSYNNDLTLSDNYFINNSAVSTEDISKGSGGAILLDSSSFCPYRLIENNFTGNTASQNGGSIHWEISEPSLLANIFTKNSAPYGPDISSFPVKLRELEGRRLNILSSVASGQEIEESLYFSLLDHYGQVVTSDNESRAKLSSTTGDVQVSGNTIFIASNGVFNITGFTVIGPPTETVVIVLSTDMIDSEESSVSIGVELRACQEGEVNNRNVCVLCAENTYSLDPTDSMCIDCPGGATCQGGNQIFPKEGFWRSNNASHVFWKCPNSNACLGGKNNSTIGECREGYRGNKCQSCDSNYSRVVVNKCTACPGYWVVIAKIIGLRTATGLLAFIMIYYSLKAANMPRKRQSIYFRILLNYVQLVMATASFELNWSDDMVKLVEIQGVMGSIAEHVFSFDCLLKEKHTEREIHYIKLIMTTLFPLMLALISLAIWSIVSIFKRSRTYLNQEMVATTIILIFIAQPSVIKTIFGAINCTEINEGEFWLVSDLDIKCWDQEHTYYAFFLVGPSILIHGLILPLFVLFLLYKNRNNLQTVKVRKMYGFLFNGYCSRNYYWEIVIFFRKNLIFACAVGLGRYSASVQALCVMVVLLVSVFLQIKFTPYNNTRLNHLELLSVLTAACTIYCGLFFLTENLSSTSSAIFFSMIVASNSWFLLSWIREMFYRRIKMITKKLSTFKRFRDSLSQSGKEDNDDEDKIFKMTRENVKKIEFSDPTNSYDQQNFNKDLFLQVVYKELEELNGSESEQQSENNPEDNEELNSRSTRNLKEIIT